MQRKFVVIALVVLAIGLLAPPVFGQVTTSGIRGKVVDATGGIPMAQVVAVNTQSGFKYQATADAEGNFTLSGLVPGTYDVKVSSEAYAEKTVQVQVLLGQDALVNVTLSPTEVFMGDVTVVGETTKLLIDSRSPTIATNITPQQIEDLPQGERNFLNYAALAPGVYVNPNDAETQVFRSASMSAKQVNAFIDGLSYKNDMLEGGSFMQDASKGNPFPQNAVQEFEVLTQNYKAEYEKSSAAVISAVTKSGGNAFHGDLFYLFQNDSMVTLDDLSQEKGLEKPDYDREQYGLAIGGPIIKDRLHFFASFEQNNQDRYNLVSHGGLWDSPNVPSDVKQRLSAYPTGNVLAPFESTLYFAKLTWQPTLGSTVDVSYNKRDEDERRGFGGQRVEEGAERFRITSDALVAKWTTMLGGSALNEAMGTLQQMRWFPTAIDNTLPRENFVGLLDVGGKDATQDFTQDRIGLRDDLSYYFSGAGEHAIKGGVAASWLDYSIIKKLYPNGYYEYRDQEKWEYPFLARLGYGDPELAFSNTQIGLYVQDDWRINSALTVSLGLRWDYETNMLNNDWVTPPQLQTALNSACRTYAQPVGGKTTWCLNEFLDLSRYTTDGGDRPAYTGMLQPRLGFAWDVSETGKTIIFGAWGKYWDRTTLNDIFDESSRQKWNQYTFCFVQGACANPIPWRPEYGTPDGLREIINSGQAGGVEAFLVDNELKPPRSDQWTLGFRHQLGKEWLGSLSYAAVRGYNGLAWMFAALPPGTVFKDRWGNGVTIPGYTNAFKTTSVRTTSYDAIYLTLDKPLTAGSNWGFNLAYTYAEAEAYGPGTDGFIMGLDFVTTDDFFLHPADFDERHRIIVSGTYGLPLGFLVSGILTLGSGQPFTVYDASKGWDYFVLRSGAGRLEPRSFLGWKNWTYRSIDLRLQWEAKLGGDLRLGLVGEAFNIFNFVNEGCLGWSTGYVPPAGETNSGFGKGECQFNTRRYQLGLRFGF